MVVGNGRGTYGIGIGFANTPKDARKDGATKALQRLEFLDFDEGRMLTTPVMGREFAERCIITPKPVLVFVSVCLSSVHV